MKRALLAVLLAVPLTPRTASGDVVTDWNVTALAVAAPASSQATNRVMAITHAAIFDAVNAVTRTHTPYLIQPRAPVGASQDAAAAAAAYGVLTWLYPAQKAALDVALKSSLGKVPDGAAKTDGIDVGRQVAEKYVAVRTGDGADRKVDYTAGATAGRWRPTPPAMEPFVSALWADVTPFALRSATEVSAPGPLPVDGEQYAREIDEVRRVGARDSKERTADQTAAAIFSLIKGNELWSSAARAAAAAKGTSVIENARIFALLNIAMMDATIAGWAIKKQHGMWRPITAIREAAVNPDPRWEPLLITPSHPDYVAGHGVNSGSAARALTLLFDGDGAPFSATFGGGFGLTRAYSGFAQAEKEIVNARVWAGIHTRTADVHGAMVGHQIAELVVQRLMRPVAQVERTVKQPG
jgi:hypothetical protein